MQELDVILAIGPNCRAISYLRDFGLTRFAAPTDWFVIESLDILLELYRTGFSRFLTEIEEYQPEASTRFRFVRDLRYRVKSIHHFEKNLTLAAGQAYVKNRVQIRFGNTDAALREADTVGLVGSWQAAGGELERFLKAFAELYPGKRMVLYNIHHMPGETRRWKTETEVAPGLRVEEFFFCDEGETDTPDFWKGNQYIWTQIVGRLRLSEQGRKRRDEACGKT